jgi:ribose transport system substrate-binding protein
MWDRSNIADAGTPPRPTVGYGDTYKDDYLALWGLGGS